MPDTGWLSAVTVVASTDGGTWTTGPTAGNLQSSNNVYAIAQASSTDPAVAYLDDFGIPISGPVTIDGIQVQCEGSISSTDNPGYIIFDLSYDDGANYTSDSDSLNYVFQNDITYQTGGATSLWGRAWTVGDMADGKFLMRISAYCVPYHAVQFDLIQVKIFYSYPQRADVIMF